MTWPAKTAAFVAWHRLRAEAEGIAGHVEAAARHDAMADVVAEALRAEGRCERCGRRLTDPVSVERGVGPDCARREGPAEAVGAPRAVDSPLTWSGDARNSPPLSSHFAKPRVGYRTPSQVVEAPRGRP